MRIDNAGRILLGSLGDGAAALTRADQLATQLAQLESVPFIGAGRRVASELRSQALQQARRGVELLGDAADDYHVGLVREAADQLDRIRIRSDQRVVRATALHDAIQRMTPTYTDRFVARVRAQLATTVDLEDPQAITRALRDLLELPSATLHVDRTLQLVGVGQLLNSTGARVIAPRLDTAWPAAELAELTRRTALRSHSGRDAEVLTAIARHLLDGSFVDEATRIARARGLLEQPVTSAQVDALDALIGSTADELIGIGGDQLRTAATRAAEPAIEQRAAVEALRIALAVDPPTPAALDAELVELVRSAASGELAPADWARLRAIAFSHGRAHALGLPSSDAIHRSMRPIPAPRSFADRDAAALRDPVLGSWRLLQLKSAARHGVVVDLVERAVAGEGDSRAILGHLAASPQALARLGLGAPLATPATVSESLLTGSRAELVRGQLAAWRLDLAGVGPAEHDTLARELASRARDLDADELATLAELVGRRGVGERLALATELPGVASVHDLPTRFGAAHDLERYRAAWAAQAAGVTERDAADRTRELLTRGEFDALDARELVTMALDLGGARRLGLPLQLDGARPAHTMLPYLEFDEYSTAVRYANAWRATLDGRRADPAARARAIDALERAGSDLAARHAAIDELLLQASDLPGADPRLLGHPLGAGNSTPLRLLITNRGSDAAIAPHPTDAIASLLRERERSLAMPAAQARAEVAQLATGGDPAALVAALYDRGLGAHLQLPALPDVQRAPFAALTRPGNRAEWAWRELVHHRIVGTTPAQAVDQLVELGQSLDAQSMQSQAKLLALLELLPPDPAATPANDARVATLRRLTDRSRLAYRPEEAFARVQRQLPHLREPLPDPAASRARAIAALTIDWDDPAAVLAAQDTLVDSGVLAGLLPEHVAAKVLDRIDRASHPGAAPLEAHAAALRALYELEPQPTGSVADYLQSITDMASVRGAADADRAPIALVDTLVDTYQSDLAPREVARLVAAASVSDRDGARRIADRARTMLATDALQLPAALRSQLAESLQRYDDTVGGILDAGYEDHPDYQDIGRIQAILGLAARLEPAPATALAW